MYLYGASGHAKVIREIIESQGEQVEALFDDNPNVEKFQELPVLHQYHGESPLIISIGSNLIRKKLAATLQATYATGIAASAIVSPRVTIGEGTVIMQGAIIQGDTQVGKHCIINTGASLDHECIIGDFAHISPHTTLCGNVSIGEGTWVGAGTTVIQGVTIGKWCVIGAGSVVTHDVPDGWLAVGNRCKQIKQIRQY